MSSFIKACSASDPNLNQCVSSVITAAGPIFAQGIPELGVKPLDPAELGKVVVKNPALNVVFEDTVVTGLSGFRLNAFKMNVEKGKALLDFTANITLKAHYEMDGKVLILPIKGNGQAKIKIANLNIVIRYTYKTVDGHWIITDHKDSYKMDHAQFKFTNLFGGNKELADTTLKFLNNNWSIIMEEIAPPAIDQIISSCVLEVRKLFSGVPADELLGQ
ncbi:circadian clock-controlled protein daywake-like [Melitaea cinxia]|uniref:circadian clock-controlled protein daywake-like n=1 Tax=Melitaea cinxia TaxID=113334 RepID=UPI001E271D5D|nr:circadian clock-controlled protein daywake-like [Melitaea cinxia]